jgi:hypothetical protein
LAVEVQVRLDRRGGWLSATAVTLMAMLPSVSAAPAGADGTPDVALKAAFLYNFAKFAEWPALPSTAPIALCVRGNDSIAAALAQTVRGQSVGGHALEVWRDQEEGAWRLCQLLFIADSETSRSVKALNGIKSLPVLTVSDGKGFAEAGGVIELFVEEGRMRFVINVEAADRSGLRLSSRLLGLAKLIGKGRVD